MTITGSKRGPVLEKPRPPLFRQRGANVSYFWGGPARLAAAHGVFVCVWGCVGACVCACGCVRACVRVGD